MPKRILAIGLFFVIYGIFSTVFMIKEFMAGRFMPNPFVITLFTGIDILRGKRKSRTIAKFWIWLGFLVMLGMVFTMLYIPEYSTTNFGGNKVIGPESLPASFIIFICILSLLLVLHKTIRTEKADAWFHGMRNYEPRRSRPLSFPALMRRHAIITSLCIASLGGITYLIINPPKQSFTGQMDDIVAAVSAEDFPVKIADSMQLHATSKLGTNDFLFSYARKEVITQLSATPEQYPEYMHHLAESIKEQLAQHNATTTRFDITSTGTDPRLTSFDIRYTRGTRTGSIEVTTKTTDKELVPYQISIYSQEDF